MQTLFLLILLTCIFSINSEFPLEMSITSDFEIITSVDLANLQQFQVAVDLKSSTLAVCCRPNRSIFQIIHNFLLNPFFQINSYACPDQPKFSQQNQVVLPQTGIISMQYNLIEAPECQVGVLGLSKQSTFLHYLPINFQAFSFIIQKRENAQNQKINLQFGQITQKPSSELVFTSPSSDLWILTGNKIEVGSEAFETDPSIVLVSKQQEFSVPSKKFDQIMKYFQNNWTCQFHTPLDQVKCLCNSGISRSFPSFRIYLRNTTTIIIEPSLYMSIDSNVCTILLKRNQNKQDKKWYISLSMFEQKIFYFIPNEKTVIIEDISTNAYFSISQGVLLKNNVIQKKETSSTNLWNLPLQLILNCCAILLLCVFVSLLIVEMIKRVSGLSEVDEEGVRGYMLGAIGRLH